MSPTPAPTLIRTEGLTRRYQLGRETIEALRGVSLVIDRGEYAAIMGPSGSGKSTLMNILGCLDTPDEGRYWVNEQLVSDMRDGQLAHVRNREIGFVFQSFALLPRATSLQNVELALVYSSIPRREGLRRAEEALDRVGLAGRAKHRPGELSGGQRQRVAIARALVTRPSLLLADEPSGNLDTRSSHEIMDLLSRLNRDRAVTLLLVTSDCANWDRPWRA